MFRINLCPTNYIKSNTTTSTQFEGGYSNVKYIRSDRRNDSTALGGICYGGPGPRGEGLFIVSFYNLAVG